MMVLKHMLHQRGLQETFTGGLGSFLLTVMVTYHVARLKTLAHTVDPKHHKKRTKAVKEAATAVGKQAAREAARAVDTGSGAAAGVRGGPRARGDGRGEVGGPYPAPVLAVVDEPM